jgi:hypothetical protein
MSDKLNVYQKVNKVMSEISYLKKTGSIGYGNNAYTAILHDHVTQALQPLCVKYGLILIPEMAHTTINRYPVVNRKGETSERYETQTTAKITVVNMDDGSDRFITQAMAHSFDTQDKSTGKAYSMAVKYCYLKLFMLASGDDEENRVEDAKAVNEINKELKDELTELLKAAKKFTPDYIGYINKMDHKSLVEKINEYKIKGE